jgi:PIN like domain
MSSDRPLEVFFDRNLGKRSAEPLVAAGWIIHLIADYYSEDAAGIPDEAWIAEGCRHGWALLTKDQRIRYRADELASLRGRLFCLSPGNLGFDQMARRFLAAGSAIGRVIERGEHGFWLVYDEGRIEQRWS